ncbi:MAG: ATP-binding protein [Gemmatimonadetes bacterium]|nr:ATP-binding protein [Gemmatimonadota bacterium]MYD25533.1 ATP-binding protein [Gemmatimonadota bacterium]MYI99332.1 ATP-binding protein [Gemmatimonadota bacterium]
MPDHPVRTLSDLLPRLERLLGRIETLVSAYTGGRSRPTGRTGQSGSSDDVFAGSIAFRWGKLGERGCLEPIVHPDLVDLFDLFGLDREIGILERNTRQFVRGMPANNVLIWGERGTGKSSVVKGLLARFAGEGLRMIEVRRQDLTDLPEIVELLWDRPERFVLFCDDLSFMEDESIYLELKALLEGSLSARPDNVLVYATSNRRHLMPEKLADNTFRFSPDDDEIHPQETVEEKVSLSDRFGLSIGFYRITQDTYFRIVRHLADQRGIDMDAGLLRRESLRWLQRASGRSGRVARQFVDDLEGRIKLGELP